MDKDSFWQAHLFCYWPWTLDLSSIKCSLCKELLAFRSWQKLISSWSHSSVGCFHIYSNSLFDFQPDSLWSLACTIILLSTNHRLMPWEILQRCYRSPQIIRSSSYQPISLIRSIESVVSNYELLDTYWSFHVSQLFRRLEFLLQHNWKPSGWSRIPTTALNSALVN